MPQTSTIQSEEFLAMVLDAMKCPASLEAHGEKFRAVLLRIEDYDEDGEPSSLTLVPCGVPVELQETAGDFIMAYVPTERKT